jgi:hypothetical protein
MANLAATPEFAFVLKESVDLVLAARATPVTDPAERRRVFESPVTGWYRDQTGSIDALVDHAPIVRIEFIGDAAPINGSF